MKHFARVAAAAGLSLALAFGAAPALAFAEEPTPAAEAVASIAETRLEDQLFISNIPVDGYGPFDENRQLEAILNTQGKVDAVWSSSDPAILDVDAEGKVTWHGGGTVTITAEYQGLKDFIEVKCLSIAEAIEQGTNFMYLHDEMGPVEGVSVILVLDGVTVDYDAITGIEGYESRYVKSIHCSRQPDRTENGVLMKQGIWLGVSHRSADGLDLVDVEFISSDTSVIDTNDDQLGAGGLVFKNSGNAVVTAKATLSYKGETYTKTQEIPVTVEAEVEPTPEPAPEQTTGSATDTSTDTTMTIVAGKGGIEKVEAVKEQASNTTLEEGEEILGSFKVEGDATDCTLTFQVGKEHAGKPAKVFVEHGDGKTEVISAVVAEDGTVTIKVDRLSVFTVVVDTEAEDEKKPAGETPKGTDDTLPQTGDVASIATLASGLVGTGALALGVLRKRR